MTSVFIGRQCENVIMEHPADRNEPEPARSSDYSASELDELTVARLAGAARRHAPGRAPTDAETAAAVEELAEIAGGRGDLLAEAAGLLMGYYRHTAEEARAGAAAYYCVAGGADLDLIPRWIEVGRHRAAAASRTAGPGPGGAEDSPGSPI